jgi:hypothetical protein
MLRYKRYAETQDRKQLKIKREAKINSLIKRRKSFKTMRIVFVTTEMNCLWNTTCYAYIDTVKENKPLAKLWLLTKLK